MALSVGHSMYDRKGSREFYLLIVQIKVVFFYFLLNHNVNYCSLPLPNFQEWL